MDGVICYAIEPGILCKSQFVCLLFDGISAQFRLFVTRTISLLNVVIMMMAHTLGVLKK